MNVLLLFHEGRHLLGKLRLTFILITEHQQLMRLRGIILYDALDLYGGTFGIEMNVFSNGGTGSAFTFGITIK